MAEKLDEFIAAHRNNSRFKSSSFNEYLNYLMGKHGEDSPKELYGRARISKQAFYKMLEDDDYHPSMKVVAKLALALHLNNRECKYLMKKAGYTLPTSSDTALIIRYCLQEKIYDIDKVNEYLKSKGQETL